MKFGTLLAPNEAFVAAERMFYFNLISPSEKCLDVHLQMSEAKFYGEDKGKFLFFDNSSKKVMFE